MMADRIPDSWQQWADVRPYPERHRLIVLQRQVMFEMWRTLYDKEEADD